MDIEEFKNEDEHFAANVRREREKRGWSQSEMARRLNEFGLEQFHPTTVSRVENGDRPVRLSEAARFADIFETTVEKLVADYVEEIDLFVDSLGMMRELKSRLVRAYDLYQGARQTMRAEVATFESWAKANPDITSGDGNEVIVKDLLSTANGFVEMDAWKLLDAHEQSLQGDSDGEHPEA